LIDLSLGYDPHHHGFYFHDPTFLSFRLVSFCFELKHSIWNDDDHQSSINNNLIKLLVDDDVATLSLFA